MILMMSTSKKCKQWNKSFKLSKQQTTNPTSSFPFHFPTLVLTMMVIVFLPLTPIFSLSTVPSLSPHIIKQIRIKKPSPCLVSLFLNEKSFLLIVVPSSFSTVHCIAPLCNTHKSANKEAVTDILKQEFFFFLFVCEK